MEFDTKTQFYLTQMLIDQCEWTASLIISNIKLNDSSCRLTIDVLLKKT